MKKQILIILSLPLMFATCGCSCSGTSWECKEVSFYANSTKAAGTLPIYLPSTSKNIPYFNVSEMLPETVQNIEASDKDGVMTATVKGKTGIGTLTVDANKNTITFSDYYKVFGEVSSVNCINSSVDNTCFSQTSISYTTSAKTYNLSDYGIKMYNVNGKVYMPAQTYWDLFYSQAVSYNGNDFFVVGTSLYDDNYQLTEYGELFKNHPSNYTYDNTLRDFAYNELCLSLDANYELKSQRNYPSFTTYLVEKGIKNKIYEGNPDASKWDEAMNTLFNHVLNDNGHTGFYRISSNVFNANALSKDKITAEESAIHNEQVGDACQEAKNELGYGEAGVYENFVSSDRTLVVNLNDFSWYEKDDDGDYITNGNNSASYIKKANDIIQANKDGIDNVIIDLTTNGGGEDEAEIQTSSWIHGKATQRAYAEKANGQAESEYVCDVNMDGKYDDKDNINGKKIYVLTSNYSYSNGNVFPGEVKGSDNVTLIGQKTGGGSCNVTFFGNVMGNSYRLSTLTRATASNWSSIETGVEPDKSLEDINKLTDYRYIIDTYINI